MKVVKNIDIFLDNKRNVRLLDVVQYDTGVQIVFALKDFEIPSGTSAALYVQKPSGKFVYQQKGISVTGNTVTVNLENQAITEHGKVPYQVSLTSGTDVITTFTGVMMVEKSLKDAGATESRTVINAFDDMTDEKVAEFQAKAEQIVQACIATIPDDYTTMEAKVNEQANAIKGHLSGALVFADDVSTVEHSPAVKVVCPDGVDPSTVTVSRCGRNLIPKITESINIQAAGITQSASTNGSVKINGTATDPAYLFVSAIYNLPRAVYYLTGNTSDECLLIASAYNGDAYVFEAQDRGRGVIFDLTDKTFDHVRVMVYVPAGNTVGKTIYPMLSIEQAGTEYEHPQEVTTHIPAADGTVSGITSRSPNMTILTDTEGVIVECEYNRDTNKVIERLTNAITALGGTV